MLEPNITGPARSTAEGDRYEALANSMPIIVWTADGSGKFTGGLVALIDIDLQQSERLTMPSQPWRPRIQILPSLHSSIFNWRMARGPGRRCRT